MDRLDGLGDEDFDKFLESEPMAKIEFLAQMVINLRKTPGNEQEIESCMSQLREIAEQTEDALLASLAADKLESL